jgi:hypothetical protein
MSSDRNNRNPTTDHDQGATLGSSFGSERWQGPGFAASWISPPAPRRDFETAPTLPMREDDHA